MQGSRARLTMPPRDLLVILVFNAAFWAFLIVRPGTPDMLVQIDDYASLCGPLLGAIIGLGTWWRRDPDTRAGHNARWAARLLVSGVAMYAIGTVIWDVVQLIIHQPPFPSWADAAYLSMYPLLFGGIVLLPVRRLSTITRTRIAVDSLMIMVAGITVSWYFVLGPTIFEGSDTVLAKAVSTAYPVADLGLFLSLILLVWRMKGVALRSVVVALSFALGAIVVADSVFDYQNLHGGYISGSLIDPLWTLGFMLIGVAACRLQRVSRESLDALATDDAPTAAPPILWRTVAVYALLPLIGLLVFYAGHAHNDPPLQSGVYLGAAGLVALLVLRQVMALAENQRLYRAVAYQNAALAEANQHLQALHHEMEMLATTDALTGVLNHRGLVAALDQELARAARYHHTCALLFCDLDHFKALNDTYGHAAGDAVLRSLTTLVRDSVRQADIVGRWGGEEFLVLLPETDIAGALAVAENLREAVADHHFPVGGGIHLTCSVGVALSPGPWTTPPLSMQREALVAQADQAMYAAKRLGRNQVQLAGSPVVVAFQAREQGESRSDSALQGLVEAFATLVAVRRGDGGRHSAAVSGLSLRLAATLGLEEQETRLLGVAGRLHDLGMLALPNTPARGAGAGADEDRTNECDHAVIGAEVLSHVPALRSLVPVIRAQHERWDGGGTPDGLSRSEIPLGARILAVAETYDSLEAGEGDAAHVLGELQRRAGTEFDPMVVDALTRVVIGKDRTAIPEPIGLMYNAT